MTKKETIEKMFSSFEEAAMHVEGVECWSARDLQVLLGYSKWDNFTNVIEKAKEACKNSGQRTDDQFPEVGKLIKAAKGAERQIEEDVKKVERRLAKEDKKSLGKKETGLRK